MTHIPRNVGFVFLYQRKLCKTDLAVCLYFGTHKVEIGEKFPAGVARFLFNPLRMRFVLAIHVFIPVATLQNDFRILIAFDTEK